MNLPLVGRVFDLVLRLARPNEEPAPRYPAPCERCGAVSSCRYYTPRGEVSLCLPHALDAIGRGRP